MKESSKSVYLGFMLFQCVTYCFFMTLFYRLENQLSIKIEEYIDTQFAKDINYRLINKSEVGDTKFENAKLNAKNVLEISISNHTMVGRRR